MTTQPDTSGPLIRPRGTHDPEVVKVSGPEALVATVPYLLGFHPRESLVLLCMKGTRRQVGPVIRVDLPPDRVESTASARMLANYLATQACRHATLVAVVCFTDQPVVGQGRAHFPRSKLIAAVKSELRRCGVPLFDAMLVRDNTVWSYFQHDPAEPGYSIAAADDPSFGRLRAANVSAGRAVMADREALRASISGPRGERAAAADAALEAAAARLAGSVCDAAGNEVLAKEIATTRRILTAALPLVNRGSSVDPADVADLILAISSCAVRDTAISWALKHRHQPVLPLFIQLAAWTPDGEAAQISAVLAVVAYRQGDGALAQVALDRAIGAEPDHPLARILGDLIQSGITPDELEEVILHGGQRWAT